MPLVHPVTDATEPSPPGAALAGPAGRPQLELSPAVTGIRGVRAVEEQLAGVQAEVDALRLEVDLLRRRDHSINYHMQRLDEELRLAAKLQQDFLPRALPAVGGVRFHAVWRPAGYVSGDLYDVARLDEDHIGFYIADAVGHGVPAALLTMFIKNALVTKEIGPTSYRLLDPGESIGRLNEALIAQQLQTGTFCTACYAVLNVRTLRLQVATAGHPAPLLLRGDDPPAPVKADGPLLGIFEGERFPTSVYQLQPGDRLVMYTDGVEVAFGGGGGGEGDAPPARPSSDRWHDELLKRRRLSGPELVADLARHLDLESGSLAPRDDLTMLVAEIT